MIRKNDALETYLCLNADVQYCNSLIILRSLQTKQLWKYSSPLYLLGPLIEDKMPATLFIIQIKRLVLDNTTMIDSVM